MVDRAVVAAQAALSGPEKAFATGLRIHYQLFTPANIATHVLATEGDLGNPREVIRLAEELTSQDTGLPPARIGAVTPGLLALSSTWATGTARKPRCSRHGTSPPR